MQDEDGYVTLNIKAQKPALTSGHKCNPCDTNWRYYGDSCYGFFKHNLTWEESKKYCIDVNATLVKITSKSILQYLNSRTGLIRWIGLSRQKSSDVWRWEDGSVLSKTELPRQRSQSTNQVCGYLKDNDLSSANCSIWKYFICEKYALRSYT
ncbi:hypothetical protein G4228_014486 [Cervus hanglu yarkandensis]|nr:hypothetical protein G4228_014486 [Cervus hanglu yarkandensis]